MYVNHKLNLALLTFLTLAALQPATAQSLTVRGWQANVNNLVTVELVNDSHKQISAYDVQLIFHYTDGTSDAENSTLEFMPAIANGLSPLEPGALTSVSAAATKSVAKLDAIVDVVLYADGSSEIHNQLTYDTMLARRAGRILGLQKANELINAALANTKEQHPTQTAANQIKALDTAIRKKNLAIDSPEAYETTGFASVLQHLANSPTTPAGRNPAEEKFLQELIQRNSSHVAIMLREQEVRR